MLNGEDTAAVYFNISRLRDLSRASSLVSNFKPQLRSVELTCLSYLSS